MAERAYVMLREKAGAEFGARAPLPEEVRDFLLSKRLMVRSGDSIFFRHDLLRAYLAAEYFVQRLRHHLDENVAKIDANWLSMFQFAILRMKDDHSSDVASEEVKRLAFDVLEANPQVAANLVAWVEQEHPHLCAGWRETFDQHYGRVLRQFHSGNAMA